MEKIYLELINEGLSIRKIAEKMNISFSSAKYWINKYGLKTVFNPHNKSTTDENTKKCPCCGYILSKKYFYKSKNDGVQGYCKDCCKKTAGTKSIERKIWAIGYKGSKCTKCNIQYPDTPYVVFDFHHLDPTKKDMQWERIRLASEAKMRKELDKCILLCANCHRIEEHKIHLSK